MTKLIELADRGFLPDGLIRFGIRRLDKKRLSDENRGNEEEQNRTIKQFIARMRQSPIAIQPHKANEQHYEVPPAPWGRSAHTGTGMRLGFIIPMDGSKLSRQPDHGCFQLQAAARVY